METLKRMIDELVTARVKAALQTLLEGESENGAETHEAASEAAPERLVRRRKRGRGRPKVHYKALPVKGRLAAMLPMCERSWKAIKAAGKPLSAIELEEITGDPQKTVESAVYKLRAGEWASDGRDEKPLIKSERIRR